MKMQKKCKLMTENEGNFVLIKIIIIEKKYFDGF